MNDIENMDELQNIDTENVDTDDVQSESSGIEVENVMPVTEILHESDTELEHETEPESETEQIPEVENVESEPSEAETVQEKEFTASVEIEEKPVEITERPDSKWYAIRTYTGHETKVKLSIEAEVKRLKLQDRIYQVIIPQETVFEVRGGKRRTKVKNFLPGYIIIKAAMDKKIIEIITNLPSVVSFVGNKSQPAPLQTHEIERIIGRVEERKSIQTIVTRFEIGDPVKVIDGPFTNFNGTVKEVNNEKQKLKVEVGILGRKTPVELDYSQVELENH